MPPGPPQLQDDEGGGIGAVHGPFHLGERPTLHCEALGGLMQKVFIKPEREARGPKGPAR